MQFPVLSIIVFAPFIAAVIMLLMKPEARNEVRVTALAAAVFDLVLSGWVYYQVYMHPSLEYQFIENMTGCRCWAFHCTLAWMA